jgi:hypothetical protein
MIEPGEDAALAVELIVRLILHPRRTDQLRQDLLECADPAAQAQIFGLVDRAHATLTDQVNDLVAITENRADR